MAVDTTHVYWSEGLGSINRVPVDGGQAETVASGLAGISDLVVEPGAVFFSEQDSGGIFRLDPSSGAIVNLALGLPFSWNYLALDPASVYWINQEHLARVPKVGGATTILASELDSRVDLGNAVLVDAEAVYWTEVGAGTVRALPR
jgi:streptogramin lyase